VDQPIAQVFLYSLLAGTATVIGSLFVLYRAGGKRQDLYRVMAFASGVLLGAAFVHLIPEAMEQAARPAAWGLVIGFAAFFALEQVTFSHACPEYCEDCPVHPMGLVAFAALTLHSLVDGLAVAAGFGVSAGLGLVAAFAVIVHEIPEGLAMTAIALAAGYGRRKALVLSLVVALATPVGALMAYTGVTNIAGPLLALLLGVAAGSFLYVGAADILPQLHRQRVRGVFALFMVGLGFMLLSGIFRTET
jgi:zinc transporter ZupT